MMVGAPYTHTVLVQNAAATVRRQFKSKGCTVHAETLKVRAARSISCPDVFVRCGPVNDIHAKVIEGPVIAVEVLSPSTKKTDTNEKRFECFTIPSLNHYVVVNQVPRRLDLYGSPDTSLFPIAMAGRPGERIALDAFEAELAFDDVFENLPEDLSGR